MDYFPLSIELYENVRAQLCLNVYSSLEVIFDYVIHILYYTRHFISFSNILKIQNISVLPV